MRACPVPALGAGLFCVNVHPHTSACNGTKRDNNGQSLESGTCITAGRCFATARRTVLLISRSGVRVPQGAPSKRAGQTRCLACFSYQKSNEYSQPSTIIHNPRRFAHKSSNLSPRCAGSFRSFGTLVECPLVDNLCRRRAGNGRGRRHL